MIAKQLQELADHCAAANFGELSQSQLPGGAVLVRVADVPVTGWNRPTATILFVVPPGYPAAQPDCFWVEPANFRLEGGGTPQNTNDANPIPGDQTARQTTWFSWHLQGWNPSRDSLLTYFKVILSRLAPAR